MNKIEIYNKIEEEAVTRYQKRFYELGETPRALGWGCKEDQITRFEAMRKNVDFDGKIVMDIGCGFADWYTYMKSKGVKCKYIGVDIIPEFLETCQKKYPEANFLKGNIMVARDELPMADIVITNGTLNFKQKDISNIEYTTDYIDYAFEKANEIVIVDFLSTELTPTYPKEDLVFYHDPRIMLDIAFSHTNNLKLVHDYAPIPQKEALLIMHKKGD